MKCEHHAPPVSQRQPMNEEAINQLDESIERVNKLEADANKAIDESIAAARSAIERVIAILRPNVMPLSSIPNQDGLKIVGIRKDGTEFDCTVVKNEIGLHVLRDEYGTPCFSQLATWRYK